MLTYILGLSAPFLAQLLLVIYLPHIFPYLVGEFSLPHYLQQQNLRIGASSFWHTKASFSHHLF